jgi:hypothetical protein
VHGGEQPLGADPGIVDQAIDRAEFVAQAFDEGRNASTSLRSNALK